MLQLTMTPMMNPQLLLFVRRSIKLGFLRSLAHLFFVRLLTAPNFFDFDLQKEAISKSQLKDLLYEEVMAFKLRRNAILISLPSGRD